MYILNVDVMAKFNFIHFIINKIDLKMFEIAFHFHLFQTKTSLKYIKKNNYHYKVQT